MFAVCLIQVLALAVAGHPVGCWSAPQCRPLRMGLAAADLLPVPPVLGVYPAPLLLAAAYGLLTALGFALWPLGRAARIPGGALFRDACCRSGCGRRRGRGDRRARRALVALTVATAADRGFALWFCAAALGTLVLFSLGGARSGVRGRPARPRRACALGAAGAGQPAPARHRRRRCCWSRSGLGCPPSRPWR